MKKLTEEQIEARMEMYEECIEHLNMNITTVPVEMEQLKIVQKELRSISNSFYRKYSK